MEKIKISQLFDDTQIFVNELGIFSYLASEYPDTTPVFPIIHDFINQSNYQLLDVDYMIGFSAEKCFSPLAIRIIKKACVDTGIDFEKLIDDTLTDSEKQSLITHLFVNNGFGAIIYNRYCTKWKKIWDALNTAYNPLENYSMEEKRTPDLTKTTNGTGSTNTNTETGIFGFNSPSSNPSGTIDGNQTDTITDRTETETGTDTTERSGNIGVTTSQQMLQSEFEVRKYDFYKEIYKDIDSILCLKIY